MSKININIFEDDTLISEEISQVETSKKIEYIEINNAYVVIENENTIVYTNDIVNQNDISYIKFRPKKYMDDKNNFNKSIEIEKCILLNTYFPNIFYHWIYDIIPQLIINDISENTICITLPLKFSFQIDSLRYFAPNSKIYSDEGIYKINKLLISYPTTSLLMPKEFVFDFFRKKESFTNNLYSNIYISRKKGFKRRILNESSLIKYLKSIDFKVYALEDITFTEQINIFKSAKFIISAHGSGLTNIIFSSPLCNIIEIYGPGCGERCFAKIAHKLGINYSALRIKDLAYVNIFEKIFYEFFPNKNPYHFRINISLLQNFLNTFRLKNNIILK
jgi:hypothetical protein